MRVSQFGLRAICTGLVFALIGFSFALATGVPQAASPLGVAIRAAGTSFPVRFTTPHLLGTTGNVLDPMEYDLGDAAFGSLIIRYITAEGGLKPYRFTSIGTNSLAKVIANTDSTLTFGISGVLAGFTPSAINGNTTTFLGTPGLRFQCTVADARGLDSAKDSGFFNLFLYDSNVEPFRFANDTIPDARLDSAYVAQVSVIGGAFPTFMQELSLVNTGTSASLRLADLGLCLSGSGRLFGRPLATGTYQLTLRAYDNFGIMARSRRDPNVYDQVLTLVINDYPITSSDMLTTSCSVTGDLVNGGRDTLRLTGLINGLGMDRLALLNSEFTFHLGGIGFNGRLDAQGRLSTRNFFDGTTYNARVNAHSGLISIHCGKGSFAASLATSGMQNGAFLRLPLEVTVGHAVVASEVLDFVATVNGTRYQLDFQQGRSGENASGGFQIVSITGRDGVALNGQPGDAWRVKFLGLPRAGVTNPGGLREGIDNITSIMVCIGSNFSQTINGSGIIGAGPKVRFSGGPSDGLQTFTLDTTSGKGTVTTRVLSALDTNIPQAATAQKFSNLFFGLGVTIQRLSLDQPYKGEHARRIFNVGKSYTDHPSPRLVPPNAP